MGTMTQQTLELLVPTEKDFRVFSDLFLCVVRNLDCDFVEAVSAMTLKCLDEGLEMSPLPAGEAFLSQTVFLGEFILGQRLSWSETSADLNRNVVGWTNRC